MTLTAFSAQPEQWKARVLGAICFAADAAAIDEIPCILGPEADGAPCEIWLSQADAASGHSGAIRYRHTDAMLFGVITLPEAGQDDAAPPLQQLTESAYRQIGMLLEALNYPQLYRVWNYMADINGISHGLERYRQFNLGRQQGLLACGRDVAGDLPAACALGMAAGPLTIAFLAGRIPSQAIENPRQISAYDYPPLYGPRSPTFARATLLRLPQDELLFISGTASIVGHQTLHHDDVRAQTRECLQNIAAILAEANRQAPEAGFRLETLAYKVYVRQAEDMETVRSEMAHAIGDALSAIFLQADVCRADLLVEIEASGGHALGHD